MAKRHQNMSRPTSPLPSHCVARSEIWECRGNIKQPSCCLWVCTDLSEQYECLDYFCVAAKWFPFPTYDLSTTDFLHWWSIWTLWWAEYLTVRPNGVWCKKESPIIELDKNSSCENRFNGLAEGLSSQHGMHHLSSLLLLHTAWFRVTPIVLSNPFANETNAIFSENESEWCKCWRNSPRRFKLSSVQTKQRFLTQDPLVCCLWECAASGHCKVPRFIVMLFIQTFPDVTSKHCTSLYYKPVPKMHEWFTHTKACLNNRLIITGG